MDDLSNPNTSSRVCENQHAGVGVFNCWVLYSRFTQSCLSGLHAGKLLLAGALLSRRSRPWTAEPGCFGLPLPTERPHPASQPSFLPPHHNPLPAPGSSSRPAKFRQQHKDQQHFEQKFNPSVAAPELTQCSARKARLCSSSSGWLVLVSGRDATRGWPGASRASVVPPAPPSRRSNAGSRRKDASASLPLSAYLNTAIRRDGSSSSSDARKRTARRLLLREARRLLPPFAKPPCLSQWPHQSRARPPAPSVRPSTKRAPAFPQALLAPLGMLQVGELQLYICKTGGGATDPALGR